MNRRSAIFGIFVFCTSVLASDPPIDYTSHVKPILALKCFACHGALKQESGLRLDASPLIRKGGDNGSAIVAGKASASLLIEKISAEDPDERMPPEGEGEPLTLDQITLLKRWINQGAAAPDEVIPPDPRVHWAYQPPKRPVLPKLSNAERVRNRVDAFLAAKHEEAGLTAAPTAPKGMLLRRLYLDLIGLPPTRNELHAFLADQSPQAYEHVVDRLLESPQYGERWGRHWMDVWRYSDWAGFGNEIRYSQRHIWRWRDWIVESLNADKAYDRMIVEMLAADELVPHEDGAIRATGYLARNWYKFDRHVWLDDTIEHTGKAFLGMTFNCARCHDHKYDPISQQEYYRLRAIFEPYDVRTDRASGETDVSKTGIARIYDARPEAATFFFRRGDPKQADEAHPVHPGVPGVIGGAFSIQPVTLPVKGYYPAIREFVSREMIGQAQTAIASAETELRQTQQKIDRVHVPDLPADAKLVPSTIGVAAASTQSDAKLRRKAAELAVARAERKVNTAKAKLASIQARIAAERAKFEIGQSSKLTNKEQLAKTAAKTERLAVLADADEKLLNAIHELDRHKGAVENSDDPKSKQAVDAAQKKVTAAQKVFDDATKNAEQESSSYQPLGPVYPRTSTGRRLALAQWIVDRRNPLTARVAVNHIWLRHFGQPLVESVDDFGLRTPRPLLADLLDYLAVELVEHDWSMKHVHRLIVNSNAYRMTSSKGQRSNPSVQKDPDNKMFSRFNVRRMEAEAVRDAVLHVAGSLDLSRGGPDIDFKQGLTVPRRSLYFRHARERQMQFLRMFDPANPRECYRRQESIRPQQAFALVNSSLTLAQSRRLAGRLMRRGRGGDGEMGRGGDGERRRNGDGEESDWFDDGAFVLAAFETVLTRTPSDQEMAECRQFLALQTKQLAELTKLELLGDAANQVPPSTDPAQRARENLVLVLFNHNDFVTVR